MSSFLALMLNGFREARRNRVTVVVGLFAIVLLLFSALLTDLSVSTYQRVLTDVGLGSMSLTLVLLTVFLSCSMLSREIERRTIFMVVSKSLSRATFVVARFAGNMLTVGVLIGLMTAIFFAEVYVWRADFHVSQAVAAGMLWFELMVIAAIGFVMSTFSNQIVASSVTLGAYISGHLGEDIYHLADKTGSAVLQTFCHGLYYLLPDLARLNYRTAATYSRVVETEEILRSIGYACGYTTVMLVIAVAIFSRRDFR